MVRIDFVGEYKIFNKDYVFMFVSNISSLFAFVSIYFIACYYYICTHKHGLTLRDVF